MTENKENKLPWPPEITSICYDRKPLSEWTSSDYEKLAEAFAVHTNSQD